MIDVNTREMQYMLEQIRNKAEHYAQYSMKNIQIIPITKSHCIIKDMAYTSGMRIYTKTLDELTLLHEIAHIIQKMRGEVQPIKWLYGYPVNQSKTLETAAWKMAEAMMSCPAVPYNGKYLSAYIPNNVLQGNLGMEFQTIGGEWNVRKLKKVTEPGDIYYKYNGEAKDDIFKSDDGFKAGADGLDLEYVTIAVRDTHKDGRVNLHDRRKLNKAATKAGEFHSKIANITVGAVLEDFTAKNVCIKTARKKPKHIVETNKVLWVKELGSDENIIVLNPNGYRKAHPQATAGIRFSGINRVVEELGKSEGNPYLHGSSHKKLTRQQQMDTFKEVHDIEQKSLTIEGKKSRISRKARGLIKLIQLNVIQFKRGKDYGWFSGNPHKLPINDKSALPLMQRTSFSSIFNTLGYSAQAVIDAGLREHLRTHNFFGMQIEDDDLIGCERGYWDESKKKHIPKKEITFKAWRDSFLISSSYGPNGPRKDLLETSPFDGVSAVNNSKAGLKEAERFHMKKATQIGRRRKGALLEFRALKRNVDPDEWGDVANSVFDLVIYANTKQRIDTFMPSISDSST